MLPSNTHRQHDDVYWVQEYDERRHEPNGHVVKIRPSSSPVVDVADLIKIVENELKLGIGLQYINVYPSGTRSFSKDNAFHPSDSVVLASTSNSARDPLIVIASEQKKCNYNNNDFNTDAEAKVSRSRASSDLTTTTTSTRTAGVDERLDGYVELNGEEILNALDSDDDDASEGVGQQNSDSLSAQSTEIEPFPLEGRSEPVIAPNNNNHPTLASTNALSTMGQDPQSALYNQNLNANFHANRGQLQFNSNSYFVPLPTNTNQTFYSQTNGMNSIMREGGSSNIEDFQIDKYGRYGREIFPKIYQILGAIYRYADLKDTREYNGWLIPSRKGMRLAIEILHGRVYGQSQNSTDRDKLSKTKRNINNTICRYEKKIEFDHEYIMEKIEEVNNNIPDVARPSRMILDVDPILDCQIEKCSNYPACETIVGLSLDRSNKEVTLCKKCLEGNGTLKSAKKRLRDDKDFTKDGNDQDDNSSGSGDNSDGDNNSSSSKDDYNDAEHKHKIRNTKHHTIHNDDDDSSKSGGGDESDNDNDNRESICNRKKLQKGIEHCENSAAAKGFLKGNNENQECDQSLSGTSVDREISSNLSEDVRKLSIYGSAMFGRDKQSPALLKRTTSIENDVNSKLKDSQHLHSKNAPNGKYLLHFDRLELKFGRLLGSGSFCDVHELKSINLSKKTEETSYEKAARKKMREAVNKSKMSPYVVKHVKFDLKKNEREFVEAASDLVLEAKYLGSLNHKNIISVHAVAKDGAHSYATGRHDAFFMVIDRLSSTLFNEILKWKLASAGSGARLKVSIEDRLMMIHDLAAAVEYLHDRNLVYRDLTPGNVGFDINNNVKLFDFGLLAEIPEGGYLTKRSGTMRYMSPDCLMGKYNCKTDVYSITVILWECLTVKSFFDKKSNLDHVKSVVDGKRENLDDHWPSGVKDLIRNGWIGDKNKRPSMKDFRIRLQAEVAKLNPQKRFSSVTVEKKNTTKSKDRYPNSASNPITPTEEMTC